MSNVKISRCLSGGTRYHFILLVMFVYLLLKPAYGASEDVTFSKIYTGSGNDWFTSVRQTSDGGYIAVGLTATKAEEKSDIWIVKTDSQGKLIWEKTYGGIEWDKANDIYQTKDGGYILVSETIDEELSGRLVKVFKLNKSGELSWNKTFNFSDDNSANAVIETKEGDFVITGSLLVHSEKSSYLWVLKFNKKGDIIWSKTYGGSSWDTGYSVYPTYDKGYIIAGITEDEETGLKNVWIIKLNNNGKKIWDKVYERYYWDAACSIQQTTKSNFIVAGYTYSKDTKRSSMWILYLNKKGNRIWDKIYGGDNWDDANSIHQTVDGNFIIAGFTKSKGAGRKNIWIVKIDEKGEIIWDRVYGYKYDDEAFSIRPTRDGGYIVAGYTVAIEQQVKDAWLLKLDKDGKLTPLPVKKRPSITYSLIRDRIFGTKNDEEVLCSALTKDKGYIFAGYIVSSNRKDRDGFIVKVDEEGSQQWNKIYRYDYNDQINAIQPTKDEGYIVAGHTYLQEGGKSDLWVFKIDKSGQTLWSKTFGGHKDDKANAVCQSRDGGYITAGFTCSKGEGARDIWIIKLNKDGDKVWEKVFGGESDDEAVCILQTSDGGYIVAGNTTSKGEGYSDIWILKLNAFGKIIWERTYGGKNYDKVSSMQITKREGYIIAGYTLKQKGISDFLILRLSKNGDIIWTDTYTRSICDVAQSIFQTEDGGFISAGTTFFKKAGGLDIWILRLDSDGKVIWNKTYGGMGDESINSIYQTKYNKFVLTGRRSSKIKSDKDFLIVNFQEKEGLNKLYIVTDPNEAKVYLNDKLQGLSPIEISCKPDIANTLFIKKKGYNDITDIIFFNNKSNDRLFYNLQKKEIKTGTLKIISFYPDVQLLIDRKNKKMIEPNKITEIPLPRGRHQLVFKDNFSNEKIIPINTFINKTNTIIIDENFFNTE